VVYKMIGGGGEEGNFETGTKDRKIEGKSVKFLTKTRKGRLEEGKIR